MPEESDLSPDLVDERAVELFGTECVNGLASPNWKDRLASIESVAGAIKRMVPEDVPVQIIVRSIGKKPGFKDSHFQCLKQRLEVVSQVADNGFKFSQRSASYCLAEVADKIGDPKIAAQAKEALSRIADHCTLSYVCGQCLPAVLVEGKNPKNQESVLVWLAQAIKEFGFTGMDVKTLLAHMKSALQNSNASVRIAAIQLIATVHLYVGPQFRGFFDQEKPALLKELDAEIEKVLALILKLLFFCFFLF